MFRTPTIQVIWIVSILLLLLWIIGLAAGWGGWLWIFFVIGLAGIVTNVAAIQGKKAGLKPKK